MLAIEHPYIDPELAFSAFANNTGRHFLDSGGDSGFSYIAVHPVHMISARDGVVSVDDQAIDAAPFTAIRDLLDSYQIAHNPDLPPFQGGLVGYFGYDLCQQLETLPVPQNDFINIPDMLAGIYDVVISFDLANRRMWIIAHGLDAQSQTASDMRAQAQIMDAQQALAGVMQGQSKQTLPAAPSAPAIAPWQPNFTRDGYQSAVGRVKDYIFAGDIFQANLSQSFSAQYDSAQLCDLWGLYRRIRGLSPAPFGAFLNFGTIAILSNSPERFLMVDEAGAVETKPIKGTRPRGKTPVEDATFAQDLLVSEKDRAENVMIVDLLRNDLSRVCKPHSVIADPICDLESFANVHHLVSTVTGQLDDGQDAIDLLMACFPGGSITGAPKIRAMEIITELEQMRRGAYCGAIGFIGFDGVMDTNIAIRTLTVHDGKVAFNVGGGIVADSEPAAEYEETLAKAAKLMAALDIVLDDQ
ncbi:aminodeoxychorismate synthase component I [Thalassospira sp. TSL5-1]|uniref:aminodeoxychorismate synthase component I n=1 Tax=Thalassospira sp. TSL5-1 TaxID=1544451 RepID=UPI00093E05B9|nr:aminodeoxychorismate synthase component I [Thalassospira sp. TSL5-1]OKH89858.1 aminobenzoate synthetase [Thalassospira sp. TSL5-1]